MTITHQTDRNTPPMSRRLWLLGMVTNGLISHYGLMVDGKLVETHAEAMVDRILARHYDT